MKLKYWLHNGKLWTLITDEDRNYLKIVPFNQVKEQTAQEILELS